MEVEVEFKREPYNGTQSLDAKLFRVVGVRNEDADDYHLYMTNLARKEFFCLVERKTASGWGC